MFDFPVSQETIGTNFFSLILYFIYLSIYYKKGIVNCGRNITPSPNIAVIISTALFIIINTISGDFFHFMEVVHNYNFMPGASNYGENIYGHIARLVNRNYLLFRTICWGGAFLLFCFTANRMKVPISYAAIFLFIVYNISFSYARASVAMSVYFAGVSFLCVPLKSYKIVGYVIGIILIVLSPQFHTSAYIMVFATLVLFLPIRKWSIALLIITTPLILNSLSYLLDSLVLLDFDEAVTYKIGRYTEDDMGFREGFAVRFINPIGYASLYIPIVILTLVLFKNKMYKKISTEIFMMYKLAFFLVFLALSFFLLGEQYHVFFYRVIYMSMIPISIIVPKLRLDGLLSNRMFMLSIIIGILYNGLKLAYSLYAYMISTNFRIL